MVKQDEIEEKVRRKLTHRGVLAHEMTKAAQDVADRLSKLFDVRAGYDNGYLNWSDVNRICRIVADNVRRTRHGNRISVSRPQPLVVCYW
jgi:hypothetical protein